jgi:hypothetical protein
MPSSLEAWAETGRPPGVGGVDQGLQLLDREGRLRRAIRADPVVGIDLDPIGPGPGLLAHGLDHFGHAAGFLRALGQVGLGIVVLAGRAVGAGGHDRPGRHEQARSRDQAVVDRLLQRHVGRADALGAEVAQGGEAGFQCRLGLHRRAQGAVGRRLLQHLIVPQGLVVGVQEEVAVQVHQARDHRRAGQVDDLGPGCVELGGGPTAAILPSLTSTAQPSCGGPAFSAVQTRAGLSRIGWAAKAKLGARMRERAVSRRRM